MPVFSFPRELSSLSLGSGASARGFGGAPLRGTLRKPSGVSIGFSVGWLRELRVLIGPRGCQYEVRPACTWPPWCSLSDLRYGGSAGASSAGSGLRGGKDRGLLPGLLQNPKTESGPKASRGDSFPCAEYWDGCLFPVFFSSQARKDDFGGSWKGRARRDLALPPVLQARPRCRSPGYTGLSSHGPGDRTGDPSDCLRCPLGEAGGLPWKSQGNLVGAPAS